MEKCEQEGPQALGRSPENDVYNRKRKAKISLSPAMNFDRSMNNVKMLKNKLL